MKETKNPSDLLAVDESYMKLAIQQAQNAVLHQDVPVGAVLVNHANGDILALTHNTKERDKNVTGHAEINAISEASLKLGDWRLSDCTLYVTLEPCPMCAGAIMAARIPRVVCAAKDPVAGAMGSIWSLHSHPTRREVPSVEYGCCEKEAEEMLKDFFAQKRHYGRIAEPKTGKVME